LSLTTKVGALYGWRVPSAAGWAWSGRGQHMLWCQVRVAG